MTKHELGKDLYDKYNDKIDEHLLEYFVLAQLCIIDHGSREKAKEKATEVIEFSIENDISILEGYKAFDSVNSLVKWL